MSSTTTHGRSSTSRVVSAATAPSAAAAATNRWPSMLLADPGDVEPAGAGLAGVGDDGAVDDQPVGRSRPVHAVQPAAGDRRRSPCSGQRDHRRDSPRIERAGDQGLQRPARLAVVERVHRAGDLLAGLVSLADHGDDAPGPVHGGRHARPRRWPRPRPPTSCTAAAVPAVPRTLEHGGADRRRVLRPGVVVGDDDDVGARPRRRAPWRRACPGPGRHRRRARRRAAPVVAGRSAVRAAATASGVCA